MDGKNYTDGDADGKLFDWASTSEYFPFSRRKSEHEWPVNATLPLRYRPDVLLLQAIHVSLGKSSF